MLLVNDNVQDGIKPMWEDDRNRRGGMWTVNIDKTQRQKSLDSLWRELVRFCIGYFAKFLVTRFTLHAVRSSTTASQSDW